jgi:hypothetical protein
MKCPLAVLSGYVAGMTGSPACNKKVNFSKRKVLILTNKEVLGTFSLKTGLIFQKNQRKTLTKKKKVFK